MVHRRLAGPLLAQSALAVLLAAVLGLGPLGWVVAAGYGLGVTGLVARGASTHGLARLGPADLVTLLRAVLVGGVAALVADAFVRPLPAAVLTAIVVVALALDGVDGRVARATATVSRFGARFDEEVDAFLLLVLSVHAARSVGWWVLAIGGARYAYAAAGLLLPWLRGPLPPRYWGKVVAATQGVVLAVAVSGLLPEPVVALLLAAALAALAESFAHSVRWRWRVEGRAADARPVGAREPARAD